MSGDAYRCETRTGLLRSLPVVLCYFPTALALGIFAASAGVPFWAVSLMALLCFSGSGQSIALQLLATGQPVLAIFSATFIVNFRYFMLSAALAPRLTHLSLRRKLIFAFGVTDEPFAIHVTEMRKRTPGWGFLFGVNLGSYLAWLIGTMAGYFVGNLLGDSRAIGLDFAVPAMFITLLVMQIRNARHIVVAVFASVLALSLKASPFADWSIVIAGVLGATLGAFLERPEEDPIPDGEVSLGR